MNIVVSEFATDDKKRWNDYVLKNADATFFHDAGWKSVLERAFGHRTFFLKAERGDTIVGILPLAQVNSVIFGNTLSSLPFCVYGGVVADDQAVADALRMEACKLAEDLGVGALEIRAHLPTGVDWPQKDLYVTFKKVIDPDDEVNLKAIPNRQRAMIRKGIANGLQSEWDSGVDRLYRVYSESVRNLGTPVFSERYLSILREEFGERCSSLMITHQGRDVAGVLSFYFRDEVLPYYGGSVADARNIKGTNDFMYWELMRRSREQGCAVFDFGRSKKGTGPFKFKKNWGFTPADLPYQYYLVKSKAVPELNPLNPKYRLMVNTWSKLPLPVANFIGPFLAKSLG